MKISKLFLLSFVALSIHAMEREEENYQEYLMTHLMVQKNLKDLQAEDDTSKTIALSIATRIRKPKILKYLLQIPKININVLDREGKTILIIAVERNFFEIVKLLLKYPQLDINARGKWGQTALTAAYASRNTEMIRLLFNAMSKRLKDSRTSELREHIKADLRKTLTRLSLYGTFFLENPGTIEPIKEFHVFARKCSKEFPWMEKEINQLMNRALALQHPLIKREAFERIIKYQRTLR